MAAPNNTTNVHPRGQNPTEDAFFDTFAITELRQHIFGYFRGSGRPYDAIYDGDDCVRANQEGIIYEKGPHGLYFSNDAIGHAIANKNVALVQWLLKHVPTLTITVDNVKTATQDGSLDILRLFHSHGILDSVKFRFLTKKKSVWACIFSTAFKHAHLAILEWLHDDVAPHYVPPTTCLGLSLGVKVDVRILEWFKRCFPVRFLHPVADYMNIDMTTGVSCGSLAVAQWIFGLYPITLLNPLSFFNWMIASLRGGNKKVTYWLHDEGVRAGLLTATENLQHASALTTNDFSTATTTAVVDSVPFLQWLVDRGYIVFEEDNVFLRHIAEAAVAANKIPVVQYLLERVAPIVAYYMAREALRVGNTIAFDFVLPHLRPNSRFLLPRFPPDTDATLVMHQVITLQTRKNITLHHHNGADIMAGSGQWVFHLVRNVTLDYMAWISTTSWFGQPNLIRLLLTAVFHVKKKKEGPCSSSSPCIINYPLLQWLLQDSVTPTTPHARMSMIDIFQHILQEAAERDCVELLEWCDKEYPLWRVCCSYCPVYRLTCAFLDEHSTDWLIRTAGITSPHAAPCDTFTIAHCNCVPSRHGFSTLSTSYSFPSDIFIGAARHGAMKILSWCLQHEYAVLTPSTIIEAFQAAIVESRFHVVTWMLDHYSHVIWSTSSSTMDTISHLRNSRLHLDTFALVWRRLCAHHAPHPVSSHMVFSLFFNCLTSGTTTKQSRWVFDHYADHYADQLSPRLVCLLAFSYLAYLCDASDIMVLSTLENAAYLWSTFPHVLANVDTCKLIKGWLLQPRKRSLYTKIYLLGEDGQLGIPDNDGNNVDEIRPYQEKMQQRVVTWLQTQTQPCQQHQPLSQ